jgi:hypothetical protein
MAATIYAIQFTHHGPKKRHDQLCRQFSALAGECNGSLDAHGFTNVHEFVAVFDVLKNANMFRRQISGMTGFRGAELFWSKDDPTIGSTNPGKKAK